MPSDRSHPKFRPFTINLPPRLRTDLQAIAHCEAGTLGQIIRRPVSRPSSATSEKRRATMPADRDDTLTFDAVMNIAIGMTVTVTTWCQP